MIYQKQQRANRVGTIAMDELDDEGKMQRHDIEIGLRIEMRKAEILEDAADQNCSIIVCHQRYLHWKSQNAKITGMFQLKAHKAQVQEEIKKIVLP